MMYGYLHSTFSQLALLAVTGQVCVSQCTSQVVCAALSFVVVSTPSPFKCDAMFPAIHALIAHYIV
jgi:hypothetical protein